MTTSHALRNSANRARLKGDRGGRVQNSRGDSRGRPRVQIELQVFGLRTSIKIRVNLLFEVTHE